MFPLLINFKIGTIQAAENAFLVQFLQQKKNKFVKRKKEYKITNESCISDSYALVPTALVSKQADKELLCDYSVVVCFFFCL